jgi:hypothetical protein
MIRESGFSSRQGQRLSLQCRIHLILGSTQLSIEEGVKRQHDDANHPSSSSAEPDERLEVYFHNVAKPRSGLLW